MLHFENVLNHSRTNRKLSVKLEKKSNHLIVDTLLNIAGRFLLWSRKISTLPVTNHTFGPAACIYRIIAFWEIYIYMFLRKKNDFCGKKKKKK